MVRRGMATPPSAPPPIPLAGLTPSGPTPDSMPEGPDQPLQLTTDQLSKLGLTNAQPGDSMLITARITIGGTPDAPSAEIVAAGDAKPDDGSADLTNLSNDATPPPGDSGLPITPGGAPPEEEGDDEPPMPGTMAPGSAKEESVLGFKRPKSKGKTISAKDALGDD